MGSAGINGDPQWSTVKWGGGVGLRVSTVGSMGGVYGGSLP